MDGDGARLIDAWEGAADVVVIDAVSSGAAPGTIHRLDVAEGPLPRRFFHNSTHLFGVAEAVETARALGRLPARLVIYGIDGRNFDFGEGLSPEVEAAATEVTRRLGDEP
jgi:hydrogenase maturation protease